MKSYLSIAVVFLLSCTANRDFEVTELEQKNDIIIFPAWKKDSLEIFIPYTFKIENKALEEGKFSSFYYKPANSKFHEDDLLIQVDDSIKRMLSREEKMIPVFSAKEYTFYLKTFESKYNVDKNYWSQFPEERESNRKILKYGYNRVVPGSADYLKFRKKIENDSIGFTMYYGEYYFVTKVAKLNENKFKTKTLDDVLANPDKMHESIFKP